MARQTMGDPIHCHLDGRHIGQTFLDAKCYINGTKTNLIGHSSRFEPRLLLRSFSIRPTPNRETIRHVAEQTHPREDFETPMDVVLEQRIKSRAELGPDESTFGPDSKFVATDSIVRVSPSALVSDGPFSIVGHDVSPSNAVSPFRVDVTVT
ncbi:hypothetical protein AVEN_228640-1 [Araneus ventricosus]|uniref:Uncharacterized protein n=1 Tax=Araneus ventricosus TaxID=182803 RepID=A0A4Y2ARW7_ARAVE|nr:hypothetical protein AVEN_106282-1 [Araneus ventricosus]GBL83322.1 hypothetical protein AVEN_228640-1 [Araneus ventricosus]